MFSLKERIAALVEHVGTCHSPGLECQCPSAQEARSIVTEIETMELQNEVSQSTIKMLAHALSIAIDDIAVHEGTRPDAEKYVWRAAQELKLTPPES
jgi:hypothetical protein